MAALTYADLVWELSTTTGTGNLTLSGAFSSDYRTFNSAIGTGIFFPYCIQNKNLGEWEVGIGKITSSTTFVRSVIHFSSNSNAAVNFSAGTKDVRLVLPAYQAATIAPVGRNRLINSSFRFFQRQTPATLTTFAQDKYGPDRWRMCRENADLQCQRIDTNGALEAGLYTRYYATLKKITNAGKFLVCQPIEAIHCPGRDGASGAPVMLSLKLKASTSMTVRIGLIQLTSSGTVDTIPSNIVPSTWGSSGTDPTLGTNLALVAPDKAFNCSISGSAASASVTTSWQKFSIGVSSLTNFKNLIVAVWTNAQASANDTLSLAEADFYDGFIERDFVEPAYLEDLRACQRYFCKDYAVDTAPTQGGTRQFRPGVVTNGGLWADIQLPVAPRTAAGTYTIYATSNGYGGVSQSGQWVFNNNNTNTAASTHTFDYDGTLTPRLYFSTYGGLSNGTPGMLEGNFTREDEL